MIIQESENRINKDSLKKIFIYIISCLMILKLFVN